MRVTFGSIFRNGLIDINRTTEELAVRQREVSSGRRIHLSSDDAAAMAAAMGERSEMAVLDQFTQTTDSVDSHRSADARRSSTEAAGRLSLMDYLK